MKKVNELLEDRGRAVEQMQALSAANPEGFSAETQEKYDRLNADQEKLKATADRLHNEEKIAADIAANHAPSIGGAAPAAHVKSVNSPEYSNALDSYIRKGKAGMDYDLRNALEVGDAGEGGVLTHDSFDMNFREIRDDYNAIRPYADVITTSGDHKIRVESSIATAAWTDEEAAYSTNDPAFTSVTLNAHKLGNIVKVTEELLQDSDFDIQGYLARMFGRSFGLAEEEAFITGVGTTDPAGIITGASSVTRTESPLGATVSAQTLLDLFYGLGRVYRGNATWMFNDATVADIRGIVDSNDNFIWQPGLQAGQPDRVLGRPFITSAYMPEAGESPEASPVVFGDLKNYTIADRTGFSIQRLDELYAANGYVGFRGWSRVDASVIQSAGIKKIAAF